MPKFTKAPEAMVTLFGRIVGALPAVETRKMFGYPAAFAQGHMFTCLFQSSMILRLSPEDRSAIASEHHAKPFEPMPGPPMREYVAVPESIFGSEALLGRWLRKAHAYTSSLPPKAKSRSTKRAATPTKAKRLG